jgi:quercetin dioxygenase-like cupin family protein
MEEKKEVRHLVDNPLLLVDLIDYQKNAVVSTTIFHNKSGSITVFAFDEGEGLSEHTAPFDALVFCLDGEVEVTVSGNPVLVKQGEMLLMPKGHPHALKAVKAFKMVLVMM